MSSRTELMYLVKPKPDGITWANSRADFQGTADFQSWTQDNQLIEQLGLCLHVHSCYRIPNHIIKKHEKPRHILSLDFLLLLFQRHLMSYIYIAPFPLQNTLQYLHTGMFPTVEKQPSDYFQYHLQSTNNLRLKVFISMLSIKIVQNSISWTSNLCY